MTRNKDVSKIKDKYDELNKSSKVHVKSLDMEMEFMDFLNLLCDPKEFNKVRKERKKEI